MIQRAGRKPNIDLRPVIEYVGLDRVIEQVGVERVIEQVGAKVFIKHFGLHGILASLSPAERRELKRRLQ